MRCSTFVTCNNNQEESNRLQSDLVLQGQDRVVLGGVDVQHVEAILAAQVVGDVCEGRAGCLGHAVVDDDHVVVICHRRRLLLQRLPTSGVLAVTLLHLRQLMTGNCLFWKKRHNKMRKSVLC